MFFGCLQGNTHLRELETLPSLWEGFIHAEPRREGQTGRLQQDCVRGLDGDAVLFKKGRETEKTVNVCLTAIQSSLTAKLS